MVYQVALLLWRITPTIFIRAECRFWGLICWRYVPLLVLASLYLRFTLWVLEAKWIRPGSFSMLERVVELMHLLSTWVIVSEWLSIHVKCWNPGKICQIF